MIQIVCVVALLLAGCEVGKAQAVPMPMSPIDLCDEQLNKFNFGPARACYEAVYLRRLATEPCACPSTSGNQ